jgi:large subunit ribosomal protein L28
MGNVCAISGKKPSFGRNVSHSKRRTNRRFNPNVQSKRIFVPELGRSVRISLSTTAIRTIDKKGLAAYLRDEGVTLSDIVSQPVRRELAAARPATRGGRR